MREKLTPMRATARLSNPFMYEAQIFNCGLPQNELIRLDDYLNAKGREGWKLHTIERLKEGSYFCVWEKLDYGEGK